MNVLSLVKSNGYWMINKALAKKTSLEAALLFADLASAQDYWDERNGVSGHWFFRTRDTIEEETMLSEKAQVKALTLLKELGLVKSKLMGVPAKMYYCISEQEQINLINLVGKNGGSSSAKMEELGQTKERNINKNKSIKNKSIENKIENSLSACEETEPEIFDDAEFEQLDAEKTNAKENCGGFVNDDVIKTFDRMCESFEQICEKIGATEIQKFTTLPKEIWMQEQFAKQGKQRVELCFAKIEAYCKEHPKYTTERKDLPRVFLKFIESVETQFTMDCKAVINNRYQELFSEDYDFQKACNSHLKQLIEKVSKAIEAHNQAPATESQIVSGLKQLFELLPAEYTRADKFKLPLINSNYQSIKQTIINGKSNNKQSTNAPIAGLGGSVSPEIDAILRSMGKGL